MRFFDSWNETASFAVLTSNDALTNPPDGAFTQVLAEAVEDFDDIAIRHLFVNAETKQQLEQVVDQVLSGASSELLRSGASQFIDRLDEFLHARCRTPRRTLETSEAIDLAERHLAQFGILATEFPLPDRAKSLFLQIAALPVRACSRPSESSAVAQPFVGARPPAAGTEPAFSDSDCDLIEAWLYEVEDGYIDALNPKGPLYQETLSWADVLSAVKMITFEDWILAEYLLRPIYPRAFDPEPAYRLWECGSSLWLAGDHVEVRTYTAERTEISHYQG